MEKSKLITLNGKAKEIVAYIRDEYLPNEILTVNIKKDKSLQEVKKDGRN